MAKQHPASVVEVLKKNGDGLSYEELRDKVEVPDENALKRIIVLEMRQGTVDIKNGRFIAPVAAQV